MSQNELFPFEAPEPAEMKDVGKGKAMSKADQAKLEDMGEPKNKENYKAKAAAEERKALREAKAAKDFVDAKRAEESQQRMKFGNPTMESKVSGGARGATGGAGGIEMEGKMGRNTKPKMKAGGKVRSASARADGCAIRGKTRA